MPDVSVAEVPAVLESTSEKQRLEKAAFKVLYPRVIASALVRNPEILNKLEREREEVLIDIADPENPAHAFEFSTWKMSSEKKRILQKEVIKFFNDNPENGILFRLRGNSLKGFVTSKSPTELEETICKIDKLMSSFSGQDLGPGGFGFFIAESAELQVKVSPMGDKASKNPHYTMIPASDSGLTYLSWAAKSIREKSDQTDSSKVFWVSNEKQERSRGNGRRDRIAEKATPTEHISTKANTRFYTRALDSKFSDLNAQAQTDNGEYYSKLEEDFNNLTQTERERVLRCGVSGFPGNILISSSGEWMERTLTPEGIELKTTGAHANFKFDFSGMGRLEGKGISIGPYLKNVFSELAEKLDRDEKIGNYLMILEGDALVLYLMLPDLQGQKMIEHYVEVQDKLSSAFSERIDRDIQEGKLTGVMDVHEIGLKLFARVSDNPISVNFYNGGVCLIANPEFTKWEDLVESYAKKGGFVAGIIHDKNMSQHEIDTVYQNIPHQTLTLTHPDNPRETITAYLIRKDSLYEQKYAAFVETLIGQFPNLKDQIQKLKEEIFGLTTHPAPESEQILLTMENNTLTTAKIILLARELEKLGLSKDVIENQILTSFKKDTGGFVLNLLRNPDGAEKELEVANWLTTTLQRPQQ